ncbi:MAG: DUF192 domain-containing protein [Paracoccus sp. (in: a-proteobacteria)]
MWLNKRVFLLWLVAALAFSPVTAPAHAQLADGPTTAVCRDDRVLVVQPSGRALSFEVEIADTPSTRAQGLMYRRSLASGTGMLFIYESPQTVSFWMRNTFIPLDLVFIDARGVVRHIHRNARPLDETPIPGAMAGDPAPLRLMVLEIGGGEAARLGLATGQAIAHPRLDPATAAIPCG